MAGVSTRDLSKRPARGSRTPGRGKDHPSSGAPETAAASKFVAWPGAAHEMARSGDNKANMKRLKQNPTKPLRGNAVISRALAELAATGKLTGLRSEKISARVDPGVMQAAAEQLGLRKDDVSGVVNAALAVAAAPDRFKTWLRTTEDTLPDDFELAV